MALVIAHKGSPTGSAYFSTPLYILLQLIFCTNKGIEIEEGGGGGGGDYDIAVNSFARWLE